MDGGLSFLHLCRDSRFRSRVPASSSVASRCRGALPGRPLFRPVQLRGVRVLPARRSLELDHRAHFRRDAVLPR